MAIFIPDCGKLRLLEKLLGDTQPQLDGTATSRLFVSSASVAPSTVTGDVTELFMPGYAAWTLTGAGPPAIDLDGNATTLWPNQVITLTGTYLIPRLAQGWYVTDDVDDTLLWIMLFPTPMIWSVPGDSQQIEPQFSWGDLVLYITSPEVTNVDDYHGPDAGGQVISITGTYFVGTTDVRIGGTSATFEVISDYQILAVTPPHAQGDVDIQVIGTQGTSSETEADIFQYDFAATTEAALGHGQTSITLVNTVETAGAGQGQATVFVIAPGHATALPLGQATATVDVMTNFADAAGDGQAVAAVLASSLAGAVGHGQTTVDLFTSSLATGEATGSAAAAVAVTDNLADGVGAGNAAADVEVTSNITEGAGAGHAYITIIAGNMLELGLFGTAAASVHVTYNVAAAAGQGQTSVVLLASSLAGAEGIGAAVAAPAVLTNFASAAGIGNAAAAIIASSLAAGAAAGSATAAQTVTLNKAAAAGAGATTKTVAVLTNFASAAGTGAATVSAFGKPFVTSVNPAFASELGGTTITLTGGSYTGATAVKFGTPSATSFIIDSDTQIRAVAPAAAGSTVHTTVTGPAGTSATSAGDQVAYKLIWDVFTDTNGTAISSHTPLIGGSYTVTAVNGSAGDFQIQSNKCTINNSALTYCYAVNSAATRRLNCDILFLPTSLTGGLVELYFRWVDASNHFRAVVDWKAGTFTVYQMVSGVETSIGSTACPTLSLSNNALLQVLQPATTVTATISGTGITTTTIGPISNSNLNTGTQYGIGMKRDDTNGYMQTNIVRLEVV